MAKKDRPWWGNNDTLWGGETFASTQTKSRLGVRSGEKFRIEKGRRSIITLIPHPQNVGTWNDSHSKTAPIILTKVESKRHERAFSMMVKITKGSAPTKLFLVERKRNGTIAFTDDLTDPGAGGGTASVER